MSDELNKLIFESVPNQARSNELLGRMFELTRPTAVYSEPIIAGDYTVITASELTAALGAGYGGGGGFGAPEEDGEAEQSPGGFGGGGGGGGSTMGRPVAAISIGPDGVQVHPIVDPTKFGIAVATAVGAMFVALGRMRKMSRGR